MRGGVSEGDLMEQGPVSATNAADEGDEYDEVECEEQRREEGGQGDEKSRIRRPKTTPCPRRPRRL